jgi:hypothetical protein
MKTARFVATAFVTLSSLSMLALQSGASTLQDPSAPAAGSAELRPVKGELVNKLDAKSAKAGDQVVVKTTETVRTANGVDIPKGSRLIGSVTEVRTHGSDSADSHIAIRFDHAELKGGQSLAIHSEIRSLSPPVVAADSMDSSNSMGSMGGGSMGGNPMGGARGGPAGGGPAGGALGGVGSAAGSAGGIANTTSRNSGTLNSAADDAARSAGDLGGSTSEAGTRINAGAAGGVIRATGVPGVMLSGRGSAASSASGTLYSSKKNVHLDSGTQIVLGISADQP